MGNLCQAIRAYCRLLLIKKLCMAPFFEMVGTQRRLAQKGLLIVYGHMTGMHGVCCYINNAAF